MRLLTIFQRARCAAEPTAINYDFDAFYLIRKKLACGHKSLDGPVKDVNGMLLPLGHHLAMAGEPAVV